MAIHVREMVKRARRRLLGFDGSMLERNLSILMSNVAQADSLTTQDSLLRLSLLESTEAVYTKLPPCPENSISLFSGQWISAIPGFQTGEAGLFEDSRVEWLSAQLGELDGWSVLELGPLEGGHTRMLEARGCSVLAVEANVDAFLRCLVVKNLFDLKASFLLGDFTTPLTWMTRYDLVMACGVLYHMNDPLSLLEQIGTATDRVFIWTHYWEPNLALWNAAARTQVGTTWRPESESLLYSPWGNVRAVPQVYAEHKSRKGFCGGPDERSLWLYREDLVNFLRSLGFTRIREAFHEPQHPNGPAFAVLAERPRE